MGLWAESYVEDEKSPHFGEPIICFEGSEAGLVAKYGLTGTVGSDTLHVVGTSKGVVHRYFNFGPTSEELAAAGLG